MIQNLDVIKTTVRIAGKECIFVHLTLKQSYNAHHQFQIVVNYETLGGVWMSDPKSLIALVGEQVVIEMKHILKGTHNLFVGLITNISLTGTDGINNNILITGKSDTVRLDGKRAMDSFMDLTLENIVRQATKNSGNSTSLDISPKHSSIIDYICQYNETDFEFLNRLSWIYGEDFYYTGTTIKFGRGPLTAESPLTLTYDVDLIDFNLSVNLVPARFNRYAYLVHQDSEVSAWGMDSVEGIRGYLSDALQRSDSIYTAEGDLPAEAPVTSRSELTDMVKIERGRAVAEMLTVKGSSRTCEVKLGKVVLIKMPESAPIGMKEVDEFLITSIEHEVDELGRYHNSFTGILSLLPAIPMNPILPPRTGLQQGTVFSNTDPNGKGRVKVQLQWQKGLGKTSNWIRVQTPDGGSSDKVASNRGFVCIPEEGDTVVVGFDFGDPNRPFVMGSLFSEVTGAGGGEGNKGKSITSRSGCAMKLDDAAGSMILQDKGGVSITFDGAGNATTNANKENTINAGISSTTNIGEGFSVLKMDNKGVIDLKGKTSITLKVGESKIEIKADGSININGDKITIDGATSTDINGGSKKINGKGGKINVAGNITLTGETEVIVN